MEIEDITIKHLTPAAGMWLTQATLADEAQRNFYSHVYLGVNDKQSNYTEWSDQQKQAWEEAHRPEEEEGGEP